MSFQASLNVYWNWFGAIEIELLAQKDKMPVILLTLKPASGVLRETWFA